MPLPSTTTVTRNSGVDTSFAAVELNLRNKADKEYLADVLMYSKTQSARAWKHYDRLGVVRYPLNRAARIAGAANLYAALVDDEGNIVGPIKRGDGLDQAIDVVRTMYSRTAGVRGLIERYFLLMKVPADAHLIRVRIGNDADGYMFLSPDELNNGVESWETDTGLGDLSWVTAPSNAARTGRQRKIARGDYMGRAWMPSPRFLDLPDSPLFTLDADCDLLYRMQIVLRAQMRSRAVMSGILYFPDTLSALASGKIKTSARDQVLDKFNEILSRNVELAEEGDAADIIHILMQGKEDAGDKIKEIVLGRETSETDLALRAELFERIMFTLDINVQRTEGRNQNHWQSWNDSADELPSGGHPRHRSDVLGVDPPRPVERLKAAKIPDEQIVHTVVWYDLSPASVRINRQEDARQLSDRLGVDLATVRRISGFEEGDAPTETEYVQQLGVLVKNPYLATFGMDVANDLDWDLAMPKPVGRPQNSPADDAPSEPGEGDPGSPDDTHPDDETEPTPT